MKRYKINRSLILYFLRQKDKENYLPVIDYKIYSSTLPEYVVKSQIKIIVKILKKMKLDGFSFSYIEKIVHGCIKTVKRYRNN